MTFRALPTGRSRYFAAPFMSRAVLRLAALLPLACSTDALNPGPASSVASISVVPSVATVSVGASFTLRAEARDAAGNVLPGLGVRWASEDPDVAQVSASGLVTGLGVGTVRIAASAQGKDALADVSVMPTPVASVRLSATNRAMLVGESLQLDAEPLDGAGTVLAGRPVTWTTTNPSVATVTDDGLVTALSQGGAVIRASVEARSAVASITVTAVPVASIEVSPPDVDLVVGQTTQLTAEPRDSTGAPLTGRMVTWATADPQVATVTSSGLVTAMAVGSTVVRAMSDGLVAAVTITVAPRPVSTVIVSPGQVSINAGQKIQLSATPTDGQGTALTGRPVTFSSSNVQVATVSSGGLVTGVTPGSATITATSEGKSGTASVTVAPEPVASVSISPSSTSVIAGSQVQLTATAFSATGQVLTGRTATWTSGAPGLASVSGTGLVTGIAPGMAVILAHIGGVVASADVNVAQVPVASVSVSPTTANVTAGQTTTLTATLRDASGNTLAGRIIGWTSSDQAIATVSQSGVVTGVAPGIATITATSEGQSGSASVTVVAGSQSVARIVISPSDPTIDRNELVQLTATLYDASDNVLTGRVVTWSSSDPSKATVDSTGLVQGVRKGTVTITATSEGQSATTSVRVR
jgi:uncharacterized protein YjdB